ncbi:hypothetical protein ACRALDRAFT_1082118 [Sodiomyces alcalophilus JCM 7366]|uniref:uncharacterized protein n=1 Tax=Sodiomyces alcalophilus JCM 7366 TaxID=591952 RepID=UPI0039B4FFAA
MKARSVEQLVYEYIFPKPRASDPQNFHAFLERNLIIEVRSEVHAFYGHLDTPEAKYPGLDYGHPIHRVRLSRWPWHRRLFRAFDHLRLTPNEIATLTKWEGTRWAKERYEKEQGIIIRDTAGDDIADWVEPEDRPAPTTTSRRAQERVARREAGETSTVLDEEWEQWLKNAIESGEFPFTVNQILQQSTQPAIFPQALVPPRMLDAARAGHWSEVPEFLHDILRHSLAHHRDGAPDQDTSTSTSTSTAVLASAAADMPPLTRAPRRANNDDQQRPQTTITITTWRPTFSELRLPAVTPAPIPPRS